MKKNRMFERTLNFVHNRCVQIIMSLSFLFLLPPILRAEIPTSNLETTQGKISVTGTVNDENGEPLPGVAVVVKGTSIGVVTDIDGKYVIKDIASDAVLQFSFVGMLTQTVQTNGRSTIAITMKADALKIEEVVAVGYGVQKKTTVTGAISTIQGKELAKIPVSDVSQSIAGKLAGISMRPNGGQPGYNSPDIHIRGIVTTGNNKPLIVVDGVKRDNLRQVSPNTIESVTILKDAAAVAPYGIGGANGVILITTKRGKTGAPLVSVSSSLGFLNPTYIPDMIGAKEYMELQNEGYYNIDPDGTTPPNDPDLIKNYNSLHQEDPYLYPDSDFTDLFEENIPEQNHSIELSGGTKNLHYFANLGYYDQQGLMDVFGYRRYSYNLSLDIDATKTTKVSFSISGTEEEINDLDADESTSHLFRSMYKFVPTQSLLYPDGEHWGESSASSPVGALRSDSYKDYNVSTMLASISVEQKLNFIKGLSLKGVFSYDPTKLKIKAWHVPIVYHTIDYTTDPYTFSEVYSTQEGNAKLYSHLRQDYKEWTRYTYQAYLNYKRTFGESTISALLVAEGREDVSNYFWTRRNNFAIEIDEMSFGSSDKLDYDNGGSSGKGTEMGYVYRLGYSYKDKYMLETAGRYDGHYYFAPGNRWGFFPSFSAAWRISEEDFMKEIPEINNLKVRGSWGKSGMLAGEAYQYLSGYNLRGNAYAFGTGSLVQGSTVSQEANPDITWEISKKWDLGFDLNMYDGLLNMEFDYFHEDREGMLLAPQVTLPVEYGLSLSEENKGVMKNDGIEVTLGSVIDLGKDKSLTLNANFSYAKNQMIEVFETDAERNNPNRTKVGQPYGTPYGYEAVGIFSTSDDKNNDGLINADDGYNIQQFGDLHPGDIQYADLSGPDGVPDGKIDSNDETTIGHPVYPLMTFGFTPTLEWKNLDISLFFQGSAMSSFNVRGFQTVPFENNGSNSAYEYYENRWTPDSQDAKYPRCTPSPYSNNTKNSDLWLVNTSFLRLKTATFGYTIPQDWTSKVGMSVVRFYVVGQNWLTFSNLDHIDPEIGYDDGYKAYPVMKSTTFGVDITF